MLDIIRKHLEDYGNARWDAYQAALADNVVYEELATRVHAVGPAAYLEAVKKWKKGFPDLKAKVIRAFESGDVVFSELEWEGTQSGPLEGPFGTIAATNQHGKSRAALVCRIQNGKIVEARHYFDVLTVLAQLGAVPGLGQVTQPAATATATAPH